MNENLPHQRAADGRRVNVTAAAEMLGCTTRYIYKLIEQGKLKAYRIGARRGIQITVRSIRRHLEQNAMDEIANNSDQ